MYILDADLIPSGSNGPLGDHVACEAFFENGNMMHVEHVPLHDIQWMNILKKKDIMMILQRSKQILTRHVGLQKTDGTKKDDNIIIDFENFTIDLLVAVSKFVGKSRCRCFVFSSGLPIWVWKLCWISF